MTDGKANPALSRDSAPHCSETSRPLTEMARSEIASLDSSRLAAITRELLSTGIYHLADLIKIAEDLVDSAHFDKADLIYKELLIALPGDERCMLGYATAGFHRREWSESCRRWEMACQRFPDNPLYYARLGATLPLAGRMDEAEALLSRAVNLFPGDVGLAREFARLPMIRRDPETAAGRWGIMRKNFPQLVDGFAFGAQSLRELGRFSEADALLEAVRGSFGTNYHFMMQSAWNSIRLGRWEEAFRRWAEMLAVFGSYPDVVAAVGEAITLHRLAVSEGDQSACSARLPPEIAGRAGDAEMKSSASPGTPLLTVAPVSDRDLMLLFEGIGDRCEFGLVQRHFGAEPIGLLRWSGISPHQLASALRSRFEGVGEPANTYVRLNEQAREYFAGDRRYFFMHTFIRENEVDLGKLEAKMCSRMSFLRDKLISDLDQGSKIFLFKNHKSDCSESEIEQLSEAMSECYPQSTFLIMRLADSEHTSGSVSLHSRRIYFGYLSAFIGNLDSRYIRYEEWRQVCLNVLSHTREWSD